MSSTQATDMSDPALRLSSVSPAPIPSASAPMMPGSVVVTSKATIVYPLNQVKVQAQLNKPRAPSPSVITTAGKVTVVTGPSKILDTQKPVNVTPILATRIVPQKLIPGGHPASPSAPSKIVINSTVTPGQQIPIAYEAIQMNHQQIIQGVQQIQTLPTGTLKTVASNMTAVANLHRIQTAAKAPTYQKVKTITSVGSQSPKNLVSRIQMPKSQIASAVHQMTPMTVNQVITTVNNSTRFQPNATITVQKSQVISQKTNQGIDQNHKAMPPAQIQKINAATSQKAQTPRPQAQQKVNSMKKVVGCLQKTPMQNHQGVSNTLSMAVNQNRSPSAPNVLKSDNSNSTQLNMTKSSHGLTVVNKPQNAVVQQLMTGQGQQQMIQKQLVGQRIQGSVNIQPKMNLMPQTLTSLPLNAKGAIMNAKIQQPQPQQMLLRLEPGKSPGNLPSVKAIAQKSNLMKNSPIAQQVHRNPPQPVKIIQQAQGYPGNVYPPQALAQKQPGCIKTIPPQKPQQRAQMPPKPGIKTSLNTNINTLKTIATPSTTVITQKSSIKTILPHQQNASSVVVKSQPLKIQGNKQIFVASQYPGQVRPGGQIKTLLPVTLAADVRREMEAKMGRDEEDMEEDDDEGKGGQGIPVRRMPLPYECLQFVLQDHNYGAPPPRTPPPPSPPLKQPPINNGTVPALPHQSFIYNQSVQSVAAITADDAASAISSEAGREVEPEGEETETAPEGEGDEEDSITRCICEFEHDDGYMICCDRCLVWQHVDCMGIDRSNIPDEYLCELCRPRRVDRQRARTLQMRKREELLNSDTSSDTSSTSSVETSAPAPPVPKKRNIPQPRKKAEPPSQPRRLNNNNNESNSNHNTPSTPAISSIPSAPTVPSEAANLAIPPSLPNSNNNTSNNNNNVTKRPGRREQNPRQTTVQARKKEPVKRGPVKRRGKRRRSTDGDDENHDAWGTTMSPLRQWIERYEEAVTNHYSPELRARLASIKVNGAHSDLKQNNNNMSAVASGKCRVNVSNNVKYLVASVFLPGNTPVLELRGKYMLSTQHRTTHPGQGRQHAQRPGPFVFFYKLLREGTEVCVDTRTYGNDARFVRRSCTPNAEVKHCLEKGALHLYIVTTTAVEKNAEITIRHEQHSLLSPNSSNSVATVMPNPATCACGNPRTCQIASIVVAQAPQASVGVTRRSSSGATVDTADGREKRRRGRKSVALEEEPPAVPVPPSLPAIPAASTEPPPPPVPPVLVTTPKRTPEVREKPKEEVAQVAQLPPPVVEPPVAIPAQVATPPVTETPPPETKKDKKKMTREERKMEAIMKAFERLEKAELRRQEVQARNAQRKESGGANSDDDRDLPVISHPSKHQKNQSDRPVRRKRRKGRTRLPSTSQSTHSRRRRLNSADSDMSSGDDDQPPVRQTPPLRRKLRASTLSSTNQHPPKSDMSIREPPANQVIPMAADLLLALANSNAPDTRPMSPSPCLQQPAPSKSPTCDSGASSSSQSSTPSTPLSSACLLVAAAVGPLAPGFKFPKTKKAMMNEWLRESPDLSTLPPRTLPIVAPAVPVSKDSPKPSDQLSSDYLNQSMNYGAKSLATLVQAANSVSGICDSPPQRKGVVQNVQSVQNVQNVQSVQNVQIVQNTPNVQNVQCPVTSGSAKKRWLRQAISEECDSPNSRPDSPHNETVAAPPKKRRIARESLSSDNYTPPTTPTPSSLDCPLMALGDASVSGTLDIINERPGFLSSSSRSLSPMTLERQIKCYLDSEMKDEEQTDMKKCEFYDNCKITPGEPSDTAKIKDECPDGQDSKLSLINTMPDIKVDDSLKMKLSNTLSEVVKDEPMETDCNHGDIDFKLTIKTENPIKLEVTSLDLNIKLLDTTTEVCDKTDKTDDTDILDANDTETRLEFDNNSISQPGISSITIDPKKLELMEVQERCNDMSDDEGKLNEPMSIDEFDVEAQMKKITGDDGDDYKEKIETSSERDKSFDGIEGLMESSKEDSGSSERDEENFPPKSAVEEPAPPAETKDPENVEERAFKEFETLASLGVLNADKDSAEEQSRDKVETPAASACSSEESMFDSISNLDCESVNESPKIFQSIPPLSERIRKKTEASSAPKKQLDFEAAIIESTIDMDSVEMSNGEHKTQLSTALRQLLEGNVDQEEPPVLTSVDSLDKQPESPLQHINESPEATQSPEIPCLVPIDVDVPSIPSPIDPAVTAPAIITVPPPPPPPPPLSPEPLASQPEVKRLKDPRTAPHERPPPDAPAPVKRKLSISEYRKRKQQSTETPVEPSNDASSEKSPGRGRSDSASSGTSSLSSDEDKAAVDTATAMSNLALLTAPDSEERKGGEEGKIGWSAAPTLVERQRENLTERLKREFGLFLSDDEEERARKQGLTAEAIMKARKLALPPEAPGVTTPQLPPQPYIPPPGSAPIDYTQLPGKAGQYQTINVPNQPAPSTSPGAAITPKSSSQFLVPEAPPGSNPYPPSASVPPAPPTSPQKSFHSTSHPPRS